MIWVLFNQQWLFLQEYLRKDPSSRNIKKTFLQTILLYAQSTEFSSDLSKHWGVLSQIWFDATHTGSFGHSNINFDWSQVGSVAENEKIAKTIISYRNVDKTPWTLC